MEERGSFLTAGVPAGRWLSRKDADDLFLELMARSNVAYWKRNVEYLAVRAKTMHEVGVLAGLSIDSARSGVSENARFSSMIGPATHEPLARNSTLLLHEWLSGFLPFLQAHDHGGRVRES